MTAKHPLTTEEREAIEALQGVRFPVASWDKRFARDALGHALATGELGDKAAPQLWRLFIRYRRQIYTKYLTLMPIANKLAAPDFRKQQAEARALERLEKIRKEYHRQMDAVREDFYRKTKNL